MAADKTLSPAQRILRARMAAYSLHAQGKTNTAPATRGFQLRFERQVDPTNELEPAERTKRAKAAMRAYMAGLALASSKAKQRKGKQDGSGR